MTTADAAYDGQLAPGMASRAGDRRRVRPVTAQQAVLRELRSAIIRGEIRPGEPVRQDTIARELGVSRVPVREAMKVLEAEGQLTYEPHRGYTVTELSYDELQELYLLRSLLEDEAIRRAIPRLDDELEAQLHTMVEQMEDMLPADDCDSAEGLVNYLELNERFHFALFERCGVTRLVQQIRMLWRNSDAYRSVYHNDISARHRAQVEHRELLEACAARDVERAVRVTTIHRDNTITMMDDVLGTQRTES